MHATVTKLQMPASTTFSDYKYYDETEQTKFAAIHLHPCKNLWIPLINHKSQLYRAFLVEQDSCKLYRFTTKNECFKLLKLVYLTDVTGYLH